MEIRDMETQNTDKKKILIIQGGGRAHGNTAQLVRSFAEGAEAAGHHTEILSLMKQEVKGCLGCNACRYGKPCIQKDSFNEPVLSIIIGIIICVGLFKSIEHREKEEEAA